MEIVAKKQDSHHRMENHWGVAWGVKGIPAKLTYNRVSAEDRPGWTDISWRIREDEEPD